MIDAELLAVLACPVCKGKLEATGGEGKPRGLACPACSLVFPIDGGISILLKEEGVPLAEWQAGKRKNKV